MQKKGVTYEIVCKACKDKYIEETERSAWARINEDLYECKVNKESSVHCRHYKEKHENEEQKFIYQVRDVFGSDATLRQVTEAIYIRRECSGMNIEGEWRHTNLHSRLVME